MKITLHGVRGSLSTGLHPDILYQKIQRALHLFVEQGYSSPDDIPTFLKNLHFSEKGTYGGYTMCVEVENTEGFVIFDAGSGIKTCGKKYVMVRVTFTFLCRMCIGIISAVFLFSNLCFGKEIISIFIRLIPTLKRPSSYSFPQIIQRFHLKTFLQQLPSTP